LCISTVESADIVVYPDSKKIAITAGLDPAMGAKNQTPWIDMTINDQPSVDYYAGESDAER
jgi:hypothetical protein